MVNIVNYEDKKIVAIIATNVDARTAMNVIGHLAISIGKYSDNEIMGKKELIDNSGISHLGISKFPFIVTKVKANKLKTAINLARRNPNIMVADYPKEMLETRTDEELIEAISIKDEEKIEYMGAILYGNTEDINEITGRFQLWTLE